METQKARECVSLREEGIGKSERQGVCLLPLRSIEDTNIETRKRELRAMIQRGKERLL